MNSGRGAYYSNRRNAPERPAAAALIYDPTKPGAPEVVATGRGLIADEIVKVARQHNVPLMQDAHLVEALARLDIGSVIPRELYVVVAEVLAFVYAVDREAGAS